MLKVLKAGGVSDDVLSAKFLHSQPLEMHALLEY